MINKKQYAALQLEYDVVLEPYIAYDIGVVNAGQIQDWGHKYVKADSVYAKTRGKGSVIAVLDTAGSFVSHPDLQANTLEVYAKNFTNSPTRNDLHGHGTHCAGIAAAVDNPVGVIGIAPDAKLIPIKVLNDQGAGNYSWIANGLRYFADLDLPGQQKIASLSLGASSGSTTMHAAVKYAISKGVIVIAAAGNSYRDGVDNVGYPARYEEVIAVGSTDKDGSPSSFSSQGPEVDVAAPGRGIFSTHKNGTYAYLSGTSMATPLVAGIVALRQAYEPMEADKMQDFLRSNASDIYKDGFDKRTGHGVPFAPQIIAAEEPEDKPKEPETTPPPPEKEPENPTPVKPIRTQDFEMNAPYTVYWKGQSDTALKKLTIKVTVQYRHTDLFATAAAYVSTQVANHFRRRGYVLKSGSDEADAGYWITHFFNVLMKRTGIKMTSLKIHVGNTIVEAEVETKPNAKKATVNNAITFNY